MFVDAAWTYKDEVDCNSYYEYAEKGHLSFWDNPFKLLNYLPASVEGQLDIFFDKISDANFPFEVQWYETFGGCCEEFDGQ